VARYAKEVLDLPNGYVEGDFIWCESNGSNILVFYLGNASELTLPADHKGKSYAIGECAFLACTNLAGITIPDGVTNIGDYAFAACSSLTCVVIPNSVTSIGEGAFSRCVNIKRILTNATTPPVCGTGALDDIDKWVCTLSVPNEARNAYKEAGQWRDFRSVEDVPAEIQSMAELAAYAQKLEESSKPVAGATITEADVVAKVQEFYNRAMSANSDALRSKLVAEIEAYYNSLPDSLKLVFEEAEKTVTSTGAEITAADVEARVNEFFNRAMSVTSERELNQLAAEMETYYNSLPDSLKPVFENAVNAAETSAQDNRVAQKETNTGAATTEADVVAKVQEFYKRSLSIETEEQYNRLMAEMQAYYESLPDSLKPVFMDAVNAADASN
jgi:uncharacterized protein YukE